MRKTSNTLAVGLIALSCLTVQQEARAELFSAMFLSFGLKAAMPLIISAATALGTHSIWKLGKELWDTNENMKKGFAEAKIDRDAIAQAAAQDRGKLFQRTSEKLRELSGRVDKVYAGQEVLRKQGDTHNYRFNVFSTDTAKHFVKVEENFASVMKDMKSLEGIEKELKGLCFVFEDQSKKKSEKNRKLHKKVEQLVKCNAVLRVKLEAQRKDIVEIASELKKLRLAASSLKNDVSIVRRVLEEQYPNASAVFSMHNRQLDVVPSVMPLQGLFGQNSVLRLGQEVAGLGLRTPQPVLAIAASSSESLL